VLPRAPRPCQAFIFAGARSLLVSHWAVYSDATVKLITGAVREMASDGKAGRAEAMRRSMLALVDKGQAHRIFRPPGSAALKTPGPAPDGTRARHRGWTREGAPKAGLWERLRCR
jgi:CHAT domain